MKVRIEIIEKAIAEHVEMIISEHHSESKRLEEEIRQLKEELAANQFQLEMLRSGQSTSGAPTEKQTSVADNELALEDQVKDFKIQNASRQAEISTLQKALLSKTEECDKGFKERDEKLKKLKGLLLAANKSISDTKVLLGEKESEIVKLTETNEGLLSKDEAYKEKIESLERSLEEQRRFAEELQQDKSTQDEELKKEITSLEDELKAGKKEFQDYRSRAQLVLQQSGSAGYEKRIEALESTNLQLEREILAKSEELDSLKNQKRELMDELAATSDRVDQLQSDLANY